MDTAFFKKMKVKLGSTATVLNPPEGYPQDDAFIWQIDKKSAFVHLFLNSKQEFETKFSFAANLLDENGVFWVSYPKSSGKNKHDINRDILWDLLIPSGWHPVSLISIDSTWSAIRIKPNEQGVIYARPNAKKK